MSGVLEYRDDDRTDIGWCPLCSSLLTGLTTGGRGLCEKHGWQDANYEGHVWQYSAYVTVFAPTQKSAERKLEEIQNLIVDDRADAFLSIEDGEPVETTDEWL